MSTFDAVLKVRGTLDPKLSRYFDAAILDMKNHWLNIANHAYYTNTHFMVDPPAAVQWDNDVATVAFRLWSKKLFVSPGADRYINMVRFNSTIHFDHNSIPTVTFYKNKSG